MHVAETGHLYESTAEIKSRLQETEQAAFLERNARNEQIRRERIEEDEKRAKAEKDAGETAPAPEPESPAEAKPDLLHDAPYCLRRAFELLQVALRRSKATVDIEDPKTTDVFLSSKLTLDAAALMAELSLLGLGHLTSGELVIRSSVNGVISLIPLRDLSRMRLILACASVSPLEPLDAVDEFATDAASIEKRRKTQKYLDAVAWMCSQIRLPGTPAEFLAEIAADDSRRRYAVKAEWVAQAEAEAAAATKAAEVNGDDAIDMAELIGK